MFETARLSPGTRVGPWCVVGLRGQGSFGAVYLAVRAGQEDTGPVALKLALYPEDARFTREAELLSRISHPGVPRLYDSGQWMHPSGDCYPYLAMQWVQGRTLYEWAELRIPSSREAMRLFAWLARALEATHAAGGVHRDVKGGNVLVRHGDGQVFLTDFGSGQHEGAAPLTSRGLPPGTPSYRAPEAWRYSRRPDPPAHYSPGPADDVFALGVTAYRLVTGKYPPSSHPEDDTGYLWEQPRVLIHEPRILSPACHVELSNLILRMLSREPKARGSARELAEALEECARRAGPEADAPLWARAVVQLPPAKPAPERAPPPNESSPWRTWLPALAAVLAVMLGSRVELPRQEGVSRSPSEQRDAGTAGVAEAVPEGAEDAREGSSSGEGIAQQLPLKPLPGQLEPDADGHCPSSNYVSINGGCWLRLQLKEPKRCKEDGFFEYRGECYLPMFPPRRTPVASPPASAPRLE